MSPNGSPDGAPSSRFPRVSGDEPLIDNVRAYGTGFSPRERG